MDLLVNRGTIGQLSLSQVTMEASSGLARGAVVHNRGTIGHRSLEQVSALNSTAMVDEPDKK
jgi:hypothetical protein